MKTSTAMLLVLSALVVTAGATAALRSGHQETCIARNPQTASQRVGFELIDMARREAWVTVDWTIEQYAEFLTPLTAFHWIKNEPRVGFAARASVLRSPGCQDDGTFTFMHRFGREFFHIADVIEVGKTHGPSRQIAEATVIKYHRLHFDAGSTVSLLVDPDGQRYIGVNRPHGAPVAEPALPAGWELQYQALEDARQVDLFGETRVLRLEDGTSFQGPLGADW